ncbi:MAG: AAA family ATPase [Gaiellaceae bacterium]
MRLTAVEVEAFRGFAQLERIDLDADAVVISGVNGVGKTSLFDAITWATSGEVPRLGAYRERKNEEVLVNRYRAGAEARVIVEARASNGQKLSISRTGTSLRGALVVEWGEQRFDGDAAQQCLAEAFEFDDHAQFVRALTDWGILRQDSMRAVLDAKPESFQDTLREMLGLQVLGRFEESVRSVASESSREAAGARANLSRVNVSVERATARLAAITARLADAPGASESRAALLSALGEDARVSATLPDPLGTPELRSWLHALREVRAEVEDIVSVTSALDARVRGVSGVISPDTDASRNAVDKATLTVETSSLAVAKAEALLRTAQAEADDRARLADAALRLLSDVCPVCGQSINEDHLRDHLQLQLADSEAGERINLIQREIDERREALRSAQGALEIAKREDERLQAVAAEIAAIEATRQRIQDRLEVLREPSRGVTVRCADMRREGAALLTLLDRVQLAAVSLLTALEASDLAAEEAAARQAAQAAGEQLTAATRTLEISSARELEAKSVLTASTAAAVDVTRDWLERLTPYFAEVFRRISPHPTFGRLGLSHDVYFGKGRSLPRVYDDLREIDANPNIIFSEGQLSVVALSFFLAFALFARSQELPFVILDDPMQFMDDRNVLGFTDLCRMLRSKRQLLITSHDQRFSELLVRKLEPRLPDQTTLHLRFESWDREGPRIERSHLVSPVLPFVLAGVA